MNILIRILKAEQSWLTQKVDILSSLLLEIDCPVKHGEPS